MKQPARLITPRGKIIELPPDIYQQVQRLLSKRKERRSYAQTDAIIRATFGKYKSEHSLTEALLQERAADRAREDAKFFRHD